MGINFNKFEKRPYLVHTIVFFLRRITSSGGKLRCMSLQSFVIIDLRLLKPRRFGDFFVILWTNFMRDVWLHFIIAFVGFIFIPSTAFAVELQYRPSLPQFGGMNSQALTILQFEKQLTDSRIAKAESAKREADRLANKDDPTATELLVASLTRSLNNQIANRITEDILNGASVADEFQLGDVTIGYVRAEDGTITVTITDANGETVVSVPGVIQ
jgi:Type VIII secretion system (T8SS), CsgF protein